MASIAQSTVTVTTKTGPSKVDITPSTRISQDTPAQLSDVTVGSCVAISHAGRSAGGPPGPARAITVVPPASNGKCGQSSDAKSSSGAVTAVNGPAVSVADTTGAPTTIPVNDKTIYIKRDCACCAGNHAGLMRASCRYPGQRRCSAEATHRSDDVSVRRAVRHIEPVATAGSRPSACPAVVRPWRCQDPSPAVRRPWVPRPSARAPRRARCCGSGSGAAASAGAGAAAGAFLAPGRRAPAAMPRPLTGGSWTGSAVAGASAAGASRPAPRRVGAAAAGAAPSWRRVAWRPRRCPAP